MANIINLRDTKGVLPEGAVYIGRAMPRYGLRASKWFNPYKIGKEGSRLEVIRQYERRLWETPEFAEAAKKELRGKNLACWCAPLPCHGDVLLEFVNNEEVADVEPHALEG